MKLPSTCVDDDGRICTKCLDYKPWSKFSKRGDRAHRGLASGHSPICKACDLIGHQERSFDLCKCGNRKAKKANTCWECHIRHGREVGRLNEGGYRLFYMPEHTNAFSNGYVLGHVKVMTEILGRPLVKGEEVHHKNRIRDDNSPGNLELWTISQPRGGRVEDVAAWAKEQLRLYDPSALCGEAAA